MSANHRHPHADILIAIAEGKQIQIRNTTPAPGGMWDYCTPSYFFNRIGPESRNKYEFRVKPELITGWIAIGCCGLSWFDDTKELAIEGYKREHYGEAECCIQISYTPGEGL